jgi:phage tail tape-measure protein
MANAKIEIEIRALDKASKVLDGMKSSLGPLNKKVGKLDKQFDKVDKSIKKTSGSFSKMKGLLAGAITVGGLGVFTKSVVEASAKAEDLKTTLSTVTGSIEGGDDAFKFINDFATSTPFDIETLTNTFIKLKSAGVEPTLELLTTFGDMASVTTDQVGALEAVTDLFSRTTSGGLGLEDLNRLADRGIPVFKIFEEKLGLARLEVSKFGQSAEGAATLKDALLEGLNEDFGGGMAEKAKNLSTSLSNLGIAGNNALIAVGEGGLSSAINDAAQKMSSFLVENEDLAIMLGEKLGQAVTFVTDGIFMLMDNMDKAAPIFELIGSIWTNILSPALSVAFDIIVKVAEALGPLVDTIGPAASTVFEGLGNVMTEIVVPAMQKIIDTIAIVVDKIKGMIDWISEGLTKIKEFGVGIKGKVTGGFTAAGDWIKSKLPGGEIPGLAKGGVLGSGQLGLVGEEGPEFITGPARITPFKSALSGVGGASSSMSKIGASTANANINFHISNVDVDGSGQMQGKAMKQYIEGISMQVATKLLRQNQGYGGLI